MFLSAMLGNHPSCCKSSLFWTAEEDVVTEPDMFWEPIRGALDTLCNLVFLLRGHNSHSHIKYNQDRSFSCVSLIPAAPAPLAVTALVLLASSSCSCCCFHLPRGHRSSSGSSHQAAVFPWKYQNRFCICKSLGTVSRCLSVKRMNIPEPRAPGTA